MPSFLFIFFFLISFQKFWNLLIYTKEVPLLIILITNDLNCFSYQNVWPQSCLPSSYSQTSIIWTSIAWTATVSWRVILSGFATLTDIRSHIWGHCVTAMKLNGIWKYRLPQIPFFFGKCFKITKTAEYFLKFLILFESTILPVNNGK